MVSLLKGLVCSAFFASGIALSTIGGYGIYELAPIKSIVVADQISELENKINRYCESRETKLCIDTVTEYELLKQDLYYKKTQTKEEKLTMWEYQKLTHNITEYLTNYALCIFTFCAGVYLIVAGASSLKYMRKEE